MIEKEEAKFTKSDLEAVFRAARFFYNEGYFFENFNSFWLWYRVSNPEGIDNVENNLKKAERGELFK